METLVFGLALTGVLMTTEPRDQGRQAATYAARATYYQGGYDKIIEPIAKNIEKRFVPKELRNIGIGISFIYRLVEDNRIEYSWSF